MAIRELPPQDERIETGAIRFGDDWPGLFIRGDNAVYLSFAIKKLLDEGDDSWKDTIRDVATAIDEDVNISQVKP